MLSVSRGADLARIVVAGFMSPAAARALSYGMAVWAMTQASVWRGAVSALRETSVVFAPVIGTLVLKDLLQPSVGV